ncbi:MAG: hypothetical protein WC728_01755 [Elusimicrobiota bacterium]
MSLSKAYYYMVPLWCVLEALFFPGMRAGALVGSSLIGVAVFYTLEGGIASAFWTGSSMAEGLALAENLLYLGLVLASKRHPSFGLSVAGVIVVNGLCRTLYLKRIER